MDAIYHILTAIQQNTAALVGVQQSVVTGSYLPMAELITGKLQREGEDRQKQMKIDSQPLKIKI